MSERVSPVRDEPPARWVAAGNGVQMRPMVEGAGTTIVLYRMAPGTRFEPHSHTFAELAVVLSGRGRFLVEDQERDLQEGDSLFLPPGTRHGIIVAEGSPPVVTLDVTVTTWTDLAPISAAAVVRHAMTVVRNGTDGLLKRL